MKCKTKPRLMKDARFKVRSFTNRKTTYVVRKQGKKYQCSCPSWIFRRSDCKHINVIKKAA